MDIRRTSVVGTTLVLTMLLAACASTSQEQPPGQGAPLADTEWVLTSLNGDELIEGTEITLSFLEASLKGSGGCNTYGGSYAASEDSLRLSDLYWTEMACMEPEGILAQEQVYFQALNAAAGYRVDGDRLDLYDEAGAQILAFIAAASEAEVPTSTTAADASLLPRKRDDYQPQSLSCNTVRFRIAPAPEPPASTATEVAAAMPTPELPAGFERHVDTACGKTGRSGAHGGKRRAADRATLLQPGVHAQAHGTGVVAG